MFNRGGRRSIDIAEKTIGRREAVVLEPYRGSSTKNDGREIVADLPKFHENTFVGYTFLDISAERSLSCTPDRYSPCELPLVDGHEEIEDYFWLNSDTSDRIESAEPPKPCRQSLVRLLRAELFRRKTRCRLSDPLKLFDICRQPILDILYMRFFFLTYDQITFSYLIWLKCSTQCGRFGFITTSKPLTDCVTSRWSL